MAVQGKPFQHIVQGDEFDPSEVMRMKALLGPNRRRPSPGATLVLACGA
jgi:hypothetical protein